MPKARRGNTVRELEKLQRRWRLAHALLLLLALAIPFVVYCHIAAMAIAHHPRQISTGDELLDAYLQAATDYKLIYKVIDPEGLYGSGRPQVAIPPAVWQEWEGRFGSDPRFWMLCSKLDTSGDNYASPIAGVKLSGGVKYLEEARRRGRTDWKILELLARRYMGAWAIEAEAALPANSPQKPKRESAQAHYAYVRQLRREADHRHGAVLDQLLTELRAAGNDQAQAHYLLARIANERGDMAAVLAELEAGNSASRNDCPIGFPFDEPAQQLLERRAQAGDTLIGGYYALEYYIAPMPNFIVIKNFVKEQAELACQQRDLRRFQALHEFACRTGSCNGAETVQCLVAVSLDKIVLDALARAFPQQGAGRAASLSKAKVILDRVKLRVRTIYAASGPAQLSAPAGSIKSYISHASDLSDYWIMYPVRSEYGSVKDAGQWYANFASARATKAGADQDFAELARLDLWR